MRSPFSRSVSAGAIALSIAVSIAALAACDDDVDTFGKAVDGGAGDATAHDAGVPDAALDAGDAVDGSAAASARLLVTAVDFVGGASELLVANLATHAVDGRLAIASTAPTTVASGGRLFVVARDTGAVVELDADAPWNRSATWSIDRASVDGGTRAIASTASVVATDTKAYALFADSNTVSILGAPGSDAGGVGARVDLARYVQAGDSDGVVDPLGGVYVPARRLVYLVLRNVDTTTAATTPGGRVACTGTKSTVVGIDVDSDTFVDLNGDADGTALDLAGVNPVAVAYDAAGDRLLVAHAGCVLGGIDDASDADVAGRLVGRQIEELSLFTNAVRTLLDATDLGTPVRFVVVGDHRAVVQLMTDDAVRRTFVWDPSSTTLGRAITAPDAFSVDPSGKLYGVERQFTHDGGADTFDAVSVRIADGRKATLLTLPFTAREPFVASAEVVTR